VGADGGGQVSSGGTVYQVEADGSGQVSSPAGVLQVDSDGGGQFTFGDLTYQVDSDQGGQYSTATDTYQVSADGSGTWTSDEFGVVSNNGDGSGQWTGEVGVVEVKGDGTGTLNGIEPIKVAPMPKFALLGKLPKLSKLKPLGRPCGTLIRISAGVLFDFDSDTVRPEAKQVLAAVAKALRGKGSRIEVNGHTDAKGSDDYNLDLSQRRAGAVVAVLEADGLSTPMTAEGFGESQPVAPNTTKGGADNPVGRQLNRRVEIVIPNS
jgi:OOP family OmpA-OmpF porin